MKDDQPKPAGEWTADYVESLTVPAFIECRDGYKEVADAHNAVLEAERERHGDEMTSVQLQLQRQLDAEKEQVLKVMAENTELCEELAEAVKLLKLEDIDAAIAKLENK